MANQPLRRINQVTTQKKKKKEERERLLPSLLIQPASDSGQVCGEGVAARKVKSCALNTGVKTFTIGKENATALARVARSWETKEFTALQ